MLLTENLQMWSDIRRATMGKRMTHQMRMTADELDSGKEDLWQGASDIGDSNYFFNYV